MADIYAGQNALQKIKTYVDTSVNTKSTVTVSDTGTATDEIQYIKIDGVEKKIAGDSYLKPKTLLIDTTKTAPTTITSSLYYYREDGTRIETIEDFSTYVDGLTLSNTDFETNNRVVSYNFLDPSPTATIGKYWIVCKSNTRNPTNDWIVIRNWGNVINAGCKLMLYDSAYPSRWMWMVDGSHFMYFYSMTDAYTKAETNALLAAKQPTLESGTNIKTINSQSLLGSGDLQISGEPSAYLKNASVSGNTLTLTKQDDTTINYSEFLIKTTIDATLVPYTKYYLGEQSSLTLTLPSGSVGDEIVVVFYSGATASTLAVSGTYLGTLPVPSANQRIELNFVYDGLNWSLLSNTQSTGA